MIKFRSIRWKNLLSTGNDFTEIDFNSYNTTLLVGSNGAGKSTLLDALTFVLFNKPYRRINKPQLINSVNKRDLLVEIVFEVNGAEYSVRRGMKPNLFEVYKADKLLNQSADNRDYQSLLEKQILRVDYKTFCQVVILGSATFVPFMQLPAAQRREIIEDLLDLKVFSTMNVLLKERVVKNSTDIIISDKEINTTKSQIKLMHSHIQTVQESAERIKADKIDRIENTKTLINDARAELDVLENNKVSLLSELKDFDSVNDELVKLKSFEMKFNDKIKSLKKEIKFFHNNNSCPTCKQDIDEGFKCSSIKTKQDKINEISSGMHMLSNKLFSLNNRLIEFGSIQTKLNDINLKTHSVLTKIDGWKSYIKELTSEIETINTNAEASIGDLKSLQKSLKKHERTHAELLEHREVLNVMQGMLKDGGIKSKIIKQYVPIMNKLINKYLADMDFFINLELNEQFEETIKSRFRDEYSYSSFSEGEKVRINIAILLAWRAISKMRNTINTNLLIMDEVFDGSLDYDGVRKFGRLISSEDGGTNVFVISHEEQMIDKFDNVIKFTKNNNFSRVVS